MKDSATDTALLIIDVQEGVDDPAHGQRNNPDAETNMASLLAEWRRQGRPIVHIQHNSVRPDSPLRPGSPGHAIKEAVLPLPSETLFTKNVNSAFVGTGLEQHLRDNNISSLVVVGLTTDHCVSASTRSASDLGFDVTLVADATATHERVGYDGTHHAADDMHNINLASLNGEFCTVRSTQDVLRQFAA